MRHDEKPTWTMVISAVLVTCVVGAAIFVGAGTGVFGNRDKVDLSERSMIDGAAGDSTGNAMAANALSYDLDEIAKFRTEYIGDTTKVGGIVSLLPLPDHRYVQRYISMETSERPYKLTIYHELSEGVASIGEGAMEALDASFEEVLSSNALVAFSMIGNMDEIMFAYRNSQSVSGLDMTKYDTTFSFFRRDFEEMYGDLTLLGRNPGRLRDVLEALPSAG